MSELAATEPDSGKHCLNSLPNELYNIDILLLVYEVLTFPEFAQLDLLFVWLQAFRGGLSARLH